MKKTIKISDHFSYRKLVRFTVPSMAMMIFVSIYGVVDGFFVSNYIGKTPFAAVNFIMPFLMILGSLGFMFGTGGSALIAKTMGRGENQLANKIFSLLVYSSIVFGFILTVFGLLFVGKIAKLLGAEGEMLKNCILYGRIIILVCPAFILQQEFQSFLIVAEKPILGLIVTLLAGFTNMLLDALFVAVFNWGLIGAASATAMSQLLGGFVPLIYFARNKSGVLHLEKTKWNSKVLLQTCANGSSELMTNISMSIVSMLYNIQLMKFLGENGVSAYGVLMYVGMIFTAIFIGYSIGTAPIISFHYGAENHTELKSLLKKSSMIIGVFAVAMFIISYTLSDILASIFVGYLHLI